MSGGQVEVLAGGHLVGATAGSVVVVAHRQPSALTSESETARTWSALHDLILRAITIDGDQFGRALGKLVANWVADQNDDVEFGVLSPVPTGLAVFLRGGVMALIEHETGPEALRGTDAPMFVDVLRPVTNRAALYVVDPQSSPELPVERGIGSLVQGVAPGSGAVLWLGDVTPPARVPQPEAGGGEPPDTMLDIKKRAVAGDVTFVPPPVEDVVLTPPKQSEPIMPDTAKPPPRRDPLPIGRKPPAKAPAKAPPKVPAPNRRRRAAVNGQVRGVKCANGHLNDPRVAFCRLCGLRMHGTKIFSEGQRPPLGFLVLDDGAILTLHGDCVIGREPEVSEAVRRGATPIRLHDSADRMSRAHAEFRLIEWDVTVVDLGSLNGTHVRQPGHHEWLRLTPQRPLVLLAGAEVLIGSRRVTFDSPHAHL